MTAAVLQPKIGSWAGVREAVGDDGWLEVTPKAVRIRKRTFDYKRRG